MTNTRKQDQWVVLLVTGDGTDSVDWEVTSFDEGWDDLQGVAAVHSEEIDIPVHVSSPVDGHGILYFLLDGRAVTTHRYHIHTETDEVIA